MMNGVGVVDVVVVTDGIQYGRRFGIDGGVVRHGDSDNDYTVNERTDSPLRYYFI